MMQLATTFKHTQESASALWTIQHNLGGYPIADVYVLVNGVVQKIMPSSVTYVDKNTCTIGFSKSYTGFVLVA